MPSRVERAWAAGFFDGEGCIHASAFVNKRGYRTYTVSVIASQKRREPLDRLVEFFGGTVYLQRNGRPLTGGHLYNWAVTGAKRSDPVLRALRPYLIVKR